MLFRSLLHPPTPRFPPGFRKRELPTSLYPSRRPNPCTLPAPKSPLPPRENLRAARRRSSPRRRSSVSPHEPRTTQSPGAKRGSHLCPAPKGQGQMGADPPARRHTPRRTDKSHAQEQPVVVPHSVQTLHVPFFTIFVDLQDGQTSPYK